MIYKYVLLTLLCACVQTSVVAAREEFFVSSQNADIAPRAFRDQCVTDTTRPSEYLIGLARRDVDVTIGGRTRQEGFYFDKALTFRDDYNDTYTFMRSKVNLDVNAVHGKRTFGQPVMEAGIRMTAFNVWDNVDVYVPMVEEPVYLKPQNFLKKSEIGTHHHDGVVTHLYLEEGWVKAHFGAMAGSHNLPASVKVGYFPFLVGRGIALGDYFDGGVHTLGWKTPGNPGNGTQRSAGILASLGPKYAHLDLYYSRWRNRNHGPDITRKEVKFKRLGVDESDTKNIQRGTRGNRHLMAGRLVLKYSDHEKRVAAHLEPYLVHVEAPELEVEFEGDSSASMGTIGCMAELKIGGLTINAEYAGQYGEQVMHALDRNHVITDDSYYFVTDVDDTPQELFPGFFIPHTESYTDGKLYDTGVTPSEYYSHVLLSYPGSSGAEYLPYRAYFHDKEMEEVVNAHRSLDQQGKALTSADGSAYETNPWYQEFAFAGETGVPFYDALGSTVKPTRTLFNAKIPFGGGTRFRPEYKLKMRGRLALLDIGYELNKEWSVGVAGGLISGDDLPFDTEVDKTYKGFVPFRDANYSGRIVSSYAVFAARKLGRPNMFSDRLMYAPVDYESAQNLEFIGLGLKGFPLGKETPLHLELGALHFWQDVPPCRWDKDRVRTFNDDKLDGIYAKAQKDLHFTGAHADERASSRLGLELHAVATWRPIPACELRFLTACFVPGQLYADIDGMPSGYVTRRDKDGDVHLDSFGTKTAFGAMFRMTYWF